MWQIVGSLASSILGGLTVAIISYLASRDKAKAEAEKLRAEAKKADAEAAKILTDVAGAGARRGATLALGWTITGSRPQDYSIKIDSAISHSGTSCAMLKANPAAKGFASIRQDCSAFAYRNKRIRLSAYVKTQDVRHAAIWFRVDGPNDQVLAFDNMDGRPLTGSVGWQKCDIVLVVPGDGDLLVFGALLVEQGSLWVDDFDLDEVGEEVDVTDLLDGTPSPSGPMNLNFED